MTQGTEPSRPPDDALRLLHQTAQRGTEALQKFRDAIHTLSETVNDTRD